MPAMIYGDFYARGYTSVTLAPPKAGKSVLALTEAVDMVTGRGFLTGVRREPMRVVYYNAEDDQDVIDARVAAVLRQHGLTPEDIPEDAWFPTSGVSEDAFYLLDGGLTPVLNESLFRGLEAFIRDNLIDAIILDPLQDLNRAQESNDAFRLMGQRLRKLANDCQCAIGLVHHTRKLSSGSTPNMDDMRGGSALRGTSRFNRLILPMTEKEGEEYVVKDYRSYFRIAETESNLTPPSDQRSAWFEKAATEIALDHWAPVARRWKPPSVFKGVSVEQAIRCRELVASQKEPPKADSQAKAWVGHLLAPILDLDMENKADKERMKSILSGWRKTDVLRVETLIDPDQSRQAPFIVAGDNTLRGLR